MIFDSIVIGKGLIGSAAAKYLSKTQENVCIVGPDEPKDIATATVYSSHYDQARIQRIIGTDAVSTQLNLESANEYDLIEKESGIIFHSPVGCLYVNPSGKDEYLSNAEAYSQLFNAKYKAFENADSIQQSFPAFDFPATSQALFEDQHSGFINPRLLIKAQLNIFSKNKGTIITDVVNNITFRKDFIEIKTLQGNIFRSKKMLLATGSFINSLDLIQKKLATSLKSETTLWAKVNKEDALKLSTLPSLLYEIDIPEYKNIYLIQPVLYPDGNYYLKMGCNLPDDIFFSNLEEIQDWFRHGESDNSLETLKTALLKIIPELPAKEFFTKRCIVGFTKHGKPYIGEIENELYVAAVGNGYSAMCSDALGKIAANLLMENRFPKTYAASSFEPIYSNTRLNSNRLSSHL